MARGWEFAAKHGYDLHSVCGFFPDLARYIWAEEMETESPPSRPLRRR